MVGDDRDNELARRLGAYGLDPISTARSIMRWKKGETQPEYPATLALLDIAGWLDETTISRDLQVAAQAEALREAKDAEARARALAEQEEHAREDKRSA